MELHFNKQENNWYLREGFDPPPRGSRNGVSEPLSLDQLSRAIAAIQGAGRSGEAPPPIQRTPYSQKHPHYAEPVQLVENCGCFAAERAAGDAYELKEESRYLRESNAFYRQLLRLPARTFPNLGGHLEAIRAENVELREENERLRVQVQEKLSFLDRAEKEIQELGDQMMDLEGDLAQEQTLSQPDARPNVVTVNRLKERMPNLWSAGEWCIKKLFAFMDWVETNFTNRLCCFSTRKQQAEEGKSSDA